MRRGETKTDQSLTLCAEAPNATDGKPPRRERKAVEGLAEERSQTWVFGLLWSSDFPPKAQGPLAAGPSIGSLSSSFTHLPALCGGGGGGGLPPARWPEAWGD